MYKKFLKSVIEVMLCFIGSILLLASSIYELFQIITGKVTLTFHGLISIIICIFFGVIFLLVSISHSLYNIKNRNTYTS